MLEKSGKEFYPKSQDYEWKRQYCWEKKSIHNIREEPKLRKELG